MAEAPDDATQPQALAVPREGYFKREEGRYGVTFPRTPANYGFTIIARTKPGTADKIRAHGKIIQSLLLEDANAFAPLKLHFLRWVLFDIAAETFFMYQAIFDTDFDKYTEDAIALFRKFGIDTAFENLEDFPADWKTNVPAFVKFVREHQCPSFWNMPNILTSRAKRSRRRSRSKAISRSCWSKCSEYDWVISTMHRRSRRNDHVEGAV